jgi:hypothetical protein
LCFEILFEFTDNAYFTKEVISSSETNIKWGFNRKMPYNVAIYGYKGYTGEGFIHGTR